MKKPWHPFQSGQAYLLAYVVSLCDRRIDEGGVIQKETKKELVRQIEMAGHASLVWTPKNIGGFGASPFNPRLWRTVDRKSIFPPGHRYHSKS